MHYSIHSLKLIKKLGVWASESFLVANEVSKEIAEERSNKVRKMVNDVANGISLLEYEK